MLLMPFVLREWAVPVSLNVAHLLNCSHVQLCGARLMVTLETRTFRPGLTHIVQAWRVMVGSDSTIMSSNLSSQLLEAACRFMEPRRPFTHPLPLGDD